MANQEISLHSYDYTPFLTAPAVRIALDGSRTPTHVNIPDATVPSPTATDISPAEFYRVFTILTGNSNFEAEGWSHHSGNEVWESWKRVYDLWNGWYIEGRINPVWIKQEWQRRMSKKEVLERGNNSRAFHEDEDKGDEESDNDDDTNDLLNNGGFYPLKELPEFREPQTQEECLTWRCALEHTVWSPRRVGEKTLRIEIDGEFEEAQKVQRSENFGVDCGRSPYPVLRSIIRDIRTAEGAFVKKKTWDQVTGTVFNLPTKPFKANPNYDENSVSNKAAYSDPMSDEIWEDGDVFPLDIRRLEKVRKGETIGRYNHLPTTPILQIGDLCLTRPDFDSYQQQHENEERDRHSPWWTTQAQRYCLKYPPRVYPPEEQNYRPYYLTIDESNWEAELLRDDKYQTRYFITNLHGGSLTVNGIVVPKGSIAGPLPSFAIIRSPGGQVSFWWGLGGRIWRPESSWSVPDNLSWTQVRSNQAWRYVALTAAEVWNSRFDARFEVERKGNNHVEDDQWDAWKKGEYQPPKKVALAALIRNIKREPRLRGSEEKALAAPSDVETEEIASLIARYKKRINSRNKFQAKLKTPPTRSQWPGATHRPSYDEFWPTKEEFEETISYFEILRQNKIYQARLERNIMEEDKVAAANGHKRESNRMSSPRASRVLQIADVDTAQQRAMEGSSKRQAADDEANLKHEKEGRKRQRMGTYAADAALRRDNPKLTDQEIQTLLASQTQERDHRRVEENDRKNELGLQLVPSPILEESKQLEESEDQSSPKKITKKGETEHQRGIRARIQRDRDNRKLEREEREREQASLERITETQEHRESRKQDNIHKKAKAESVDQNNIREARVAAAEKRFREQGPNTELLEAEARRIKLIEEAQRKKAQMRRAKILAIPDYKSLPSSPPPAMLSSHQPRSDSRPPGLRSPPENEKDYRALRIAEINRRRGTVSAPDSFATAEFTMGREEYLKWEWKMWRELQPTVAEQSMSDALCEHRRVLLHTLHKGLSSRAWLAYTGERNPRRDNYKQKYARDQGVIDFDALFKREWEKYKGSNEDAETDQGEKDLAWLLRQASDWEAQQEVWALTEPLKYKLDDMDDVGLF